MVREALKANPPDHGSAWQGLAELYGTIRSRAVGLVDGPERAELDELFPPSIDTSNARGSVTRNPEIMFAQQDVNSTARTLLGSLMGWLEGCVEAAERTERMRLEAEAYASARLKAEGSK